LAGSASTEPNQVPLPLEDYLQGNHYASLFCTFTLQVVVLSG